MEYIDPKIIYLNRMGEALLSIIFYRAISVTHILTYSKTVYKVREPMISTVKYLTLINLHTLHWYSAERSTFCYLNLDNIFHVVTLIFVQI